MDDDPDVEVVIVDHYLDPELPSVNAAALDSGRRWLLAAPDGREAWFGPLFAPDRGPCWECLAQRLRLHREPPDQGSPVPAEPAASTAAHSILASLLAHRLDEGGAAGADHVLTIDTRTWLGTRHPVAWRPQCPACGEPGPPAAEARPPPLRARGACLASSGLRSLDAGESLRRMERHVSPVSGVAARVVRSLAAEGAAHVYVAEAPRPAAGKGSTDAAAHASAVGEALERYCLMFSDEVPMRRASVDELGDAAVAPNSLMCFSDAQLAHRDGAGTPDESFAAHMPEPLDPAAPIDWCPAWSLTAGRERLLPAACCYLDADVAGSEFCVADSNGCAAGATLVEAALHGLLELVERDHVALWWYNRLEVPGVPLGEVADPWLGRVRAELAAAGRELWALDLTADLGIPVVVALATVAGNPSRVTIGLGAHLDRDRAVVRAVAELLQIQWAPSQGLGHGPELPLQDQANGFLRPGEPSASGARSEPIAVSYDLRADLDAVVDRLEGRGLEILLLDQSLPDIGVPVVRMAVPGLRPHWPRFAPGRLYDVPVSLGLLDRPLDESRLTQRPLVP